MTKSVLKKPPVKKPASRSVRGASAGKPVVEATAAKASLKALVKKAPIEKPTPVAAEAVPVETEFPEADAPEMPSVEDGPEKKETPKRLGLATRLKALLAREISDIETQPSCELAEADREKTARRLSSLVRTFDKLTEIERIASAGRKKKTVYGVKEHEAMRAELERRLSGLIAPGPAARLSQKPDGEGDGVSA